MSDFRHPADLELIGAATLGCADWLFGAGNADSGPKILNPQAKNADALPFRSRIAYTKSASIADTYREE
jgi:hypothetical protein